MGKSSTTSFCEIYEDKEHYVGAMYRQYDGYISGHGADLKKFLKGKKIVNGVGFGADMSKCFNGMGCLGASVIAHFKKEIGSFYLTNPNDIQSYNYKIYAYVPKKFEQPEGTINIKVTNYDDKIFYDGPIDDMPIILED
jgi:hypothetical protein